MVAVKSFVGLLTTLAMAKAAKLNADSLYHVVADVPGTDVADGDCFSILETSQALSANHPQRIAHGVHDLTLADLRHYFNPNANETNNIPTVNRNLSSSEPILNDAPDIGRSGRFQTMGLLVAEEVVLNEDRDWDLHNADTLDKLLHALHMHEMWTETSRLYQNLLANPPTNPNICPCLVDVENNGIYFHLRHIAMLIREPELEYNTENKRRPRGGRALPLELYNGSYRKGYKTGSGSSTKKRAAEKEEEEDPVITEVANYSKSYWVDLFNGFAGMTDPVSSDLALFLYCMLN